MYNYQAIEKKWQTFWEENSIYKVGAGLPRPYKKYYILEMYPYPSGDLHIGQFRNYVIGDTRARFKMLQGYDVMYPFGWDAFGLPAEEAAIKRGIEPKKWTLSNIDVSRSTLKLMGISYDWDREINTCEPAFYKWTQWLFLKLFERGLAYRKEAYVNWCPHCNTTLANEQVGAGRCWRCATPITRRELTQWFFKITAYADRLLSDLDKLTEWPERVKTLQRNWIGKSDGIEIDFLYNGDKISVFTTRPDTIYGVTFIAVAPESELTSKIIKCSKRKSELIKYVETSLRRTDIERSSNIRDKDGIFTSEYAINPLSGERVQIWVADYVLPSYGTGVVMGVPAHDSRDFEFAMRYKIPIKKVIQPPYGEEPNGAYTEPGILVNSGPFSGIDSQEAILRIKAYVEKKGIGRSKLNYRLKDWLISRQRYWGTPIPMIHCNKCGVVPVPYKDLPVRLPERVDFTPKGKSPLASATEFIKSSCPNCGKVAERDSDTMDTFVDSSWYYLRYLDPKNETEPFSQTSVKTWFPIDEYIGGIEHATGHLIYFRFITKFLYDEGLLPQDEPCIRLFTHGMIMDRNGNVMSKSRGNAVPVGPFVKRWGADTSRITILFIGPPDKDAVWTEAGVAGASRFLKRVYNLIHENRNIPKIVQKEATPLYRSLNYTIKKVTKDIETFSHNTAIASLMEFLNKLYKSKEDPCFGYSLQVFVQLLAPFAPHIADELWSDLGNTGSVFKSKWPEWEEIEEEKITILVEINGKLRAKFTAFCDIEEEEARLQAIQIPKIAESIKNREIKKTIFVKNKLINFVI